VADPLFVWEADGIQPPERFVAELRAKGVQIWVRLPAMTDYISLGAEGPEMAFKSGHSASVTLPLLEAAKLAQALLHCPPIPELIGKVPHVMWFDDDTQRDQFIARFEAKLRELGTSLPRLELDAPNRSG
jgi:hypothetical protein